MSAPRRLTPPSAQVAPLATAPPASLPWDLAEFSAPRAGGASGSTPRDLTFLREEMQSQHVHAVAEARRAGFEEGRRVGQDEAQQAADCRVADAMAALGAAATAVHQHEVHYAGVLEENLAALACAVARQVLQREVQLDPSQIRSLVQGALAHFPHESALRVRLHPADHAQLTGDSSYPEIGWVADARIVRGGCVVEGRERLIDGRIDLALEQIFRRLTGTDA